jgi:antitoxin (DNA-binding transcriptional repressor) of toxin-antitoxin stability system
MLPRESITPRTLGLAHLSRARSCACVFPSASPRNDTCLGAVAAPSIARGPVFSRANYGPPRPAGDLPTRGLPSVPSSEIVGNVTTSKRFMEWPVSATEPNRKFLKPLRAVREGHSYVVTSHRRSVAKIGPVEKYCAVTSGVPSALLKRLQSEPVVSIGRWN